MNKVLVAVRLSPLLLSWMLSPVEGASVTGR